MSEQKMAPESLDTIDYNGRILPLWFRNGRYYTTVNETTIEAFTAAPVDVADLMEKGPDNTWSYGSSPEIALVAALMNSVAMDTNASLNKTKQSIINVISDAVGESTPPSNSNIKFIPAGRSDTAALFIKSGLFDNSKLPHTPFLVFKLNDKNGSIETQLVHSSGDLLKFPSETQVMVQWPGKWRSDFFHFTVADYIAFKNGEASTDLF